MPLPPALSVGMAALALGMAGVFVFALWCPDAAPAAKRRWALVGAALAALVLGGSAALVASGALADLDARPPPAGLFLVALGAGTTALAFSRVGDRLLAWPLWALVGGQAFRIGVEAWLAAAHGAGVVPAAVSWHGHNFDVLTGLLAVPLAVWLWRGTAPRAAVWAWNVLGLALLAVVVATAALSMFDVVPTEPRMTLPVTVPGVWLPAWLVQLALLGHLLVFRALRRAGASGVGTDSGAPASG